MVRRLAQSLVVAVLSAFQGKMTAAEQEVLQYVNPLIGTVNLGHVFAGATLPYGFVKAVSDVTNNNRGGYAGDGKTVSGFSHMHDSGTGGGSSLGNFPLFPYAACVNDDPDECAPFTKSQRAVGFNLSSVTASPGYFSIQLNTDVVGEATAAAHTALYRFTFPENPSVKNSTLKPMIILDLTDLYDSLSSGKVTVDQETGRMTGNGRFMTSFGSGYYSSYFCADFAGADILSSGIWSRSQTDPNKNTLSVTSNSVGGGYIQFAKPKTNNVINARVGMSFISVEQACDHAEKEIPNFRKSFQKTVNAARNAWADKFGVIQVQTGGVGKRLQEVFWSGVYRSMISPQNYTGENPLWNSDEPYYDSYYCIWDSFRSTHPFLTVVDPKIQTEMVRSLIDIYKHAGYLPDCRMQLSKGYTQGGSNAEILLADSYYKGISDGVDWEMAYQGMIHDAEVQPYEWLLEGRGHLKNYKQLGYIPVNDPSTGYGLQGSSISRTVEYAYDDFSIAAMAKEMGKTGDYKKYIRRARSWKNLFKANQTSSFVNGTDTGFVGFLQPRLVNGKWGYQDPTRGSPQNIKNCCGSFSQDIETYEGSSWLYTFFLPGDMATLIKRLGGRKKFLQRLQYMHDNNLVDIGNEQAFLTNFQYHYAGRPGLSARQIRQYIPSDFNTTAAGLPGNDDSGAVGSFIAWSMMGFFPNPGQNVYLILPPYFKSVSITNTITGKTATIKNVNFKPASKAFYIQSAKLNGKAYTKNWIDHSFFLNGGTLELTLGATESSWGTKPGDVPPSLSTTGIHPGVGVK